MLTEPHMALSFKTESELKPVLGAYAAMARNNAFLTVMDIMDQIHIRQRDLYDRSGKKADPEAGIWMLDLFPKNNSLLPEQEARASRLLRSHFPFLDLTEDIKDTDNLDGSVRKANLSYAELCGSFLSMVEVLSRLRDCNLHYKINDDRIRDYYFRRAERETGFILRDVLKASPRKIKERYKGMALLDQKSMEFLLKDNYVRQGRKFVFNKHWPFNPQRSPLPSEGTVLKNGAPVLDRFSGKPQVFDRLSLFGEVLLIALFTERRYIPDLLRDCGLDENFKEPVLDGMMSRQRIIREVISAYAIHLPERKLDIETGATQVMLDMLNELARCPSELYDVLPEGERRTFDIVGSDGSQVCMKRYSDRYIPLVLRYFDTTEEFKKLRFQVNTGLLRYELHGVKDYMDGVGRARIVQEGVNGFGRIQDMEAKRTEGNTYLGFPILETDDDGRLTEMPYITDSAARYILNGDLIGLSIQGDAAPIVETTTNVDGPRYKTRCRQPDCWLSRYELPSLAFYTFLSRKYHAERTAEDFIEDVVRKYRSFFNGVAEGSITSLEGVDIPKKDLPEKLLPYLLGVADPADFQRFKNGVVSKMVAETERLLNRLKDDQKAIGTKDNRIGKRSYVRIRPGKLAEFLAEDIVRFQGHPEGRPEAKLTGQQYSILQGMLATFQEGLADACRRAGLLDGETAHPFLQRVFVKHGEDMSSTIDFYKAYLEERLSYLKSDVPDNAPFLHPGRKKWAEEKNGDYYKALASRYVKDEKTGEDVGIFLPRGLFEEPILDIIRKHCPSTDSEVRRALKESGRANTYFVILTYLERELDDQNQGFYFNEDRLKEYGFSKAILKEKEENGFRRLSHILRRERDAKPDGLYFSALMDESNWKDDGKKSGPIKADTEELSVKLRNAYKRKCENEKAIRRYMVQDITLFLLARSLVRVAGNSVNLWSVGPSGHGILDQRVDVMTRYRKYIIRQEGIKIKDYGEIYKILKDKRIDSLLRNQRKSGAEVIDLEDIKEELVVYNRKRPPMVKSIQEYEKGIYEANKEHFDGITERFGFKEILDADMQSSPLTKEAVRKVRNAVSHNQYPDRVVTGDSGKIELYRPDLPEMAKDIADTTERLIKYGPELGRQESD